MDAAFLLDPFPWYKEQRRARPVHLDPSYGTWMVFKYADAQRVLSDWRAFSSRAGRGPANDPANPLSASLISTDPPRHRQLRALVEQAFTPRQVEALAPRIGEIADELLASAGEHGMDFVADFAYPLPVIVIAEILGIPSVHRERFKRWSDAVVTGDQARRESAEMAAYFTRLIGERRVNAGEDLISGLLAAQVEGERLSVTELLGFCVLLLVARNETTTNLLANAILTLDEHPAAREQLRAEPSLLPGAIEEVLRYRSPVQSMFRVSTEESTLAGGRIPAGQWVTAWIGSANRDEEQFERPDDFDITRAANRHLAFGHGVHFCLGAPLARLEARIALGSVLSRHPHLRVKEGVRLEPVPSTIVHGVKRLPVTY